MMNKESENDELRPQPQLARALQELLPRAEVPAALDEQVLAAAHQHLASVRASRKAGAWQRLNCLLALEAGMRWLYHRPAWAATAAIGILMLALAAGLGVRNAFHPHYARTDINHDGVTDVADALLLAQKVERKETFSLELDLNGDGVVDQHDAEWLADFVVALDRQTDSPPGKSGNSPSGFSAASLAVVPMPGLHCSHRYSGAWYFTEE